MHSTSKMPIDFSSRLEPIGRILDLSDQGMVVWSCSPIYGPDGKVHVFFTRVPGPMDHWFQSFRTKAEIVHAIADRPEGPYHVQEVVLKGRGDGHWDGHGIVNPRVYQVGEKYALFYTSYEVPWPRECMKEHIGLMLSDDLIHWESANGGEPILSPDLNPSVWDSQIVNNASFVKVTNPPQYRLYYRGVKDLKKFDIGMATSDDLEGPYKKYPANPVIDSSSLTNPIVPAFRGLEDPCVWIENGQFKMLTKDMGYLDQPGGCYQESDDGIHWSLPSRGYHNAKIYWNQEGHLDSPLFLYDKHGQPEYLFTNRFTDGRATGFVFKINPS